MSKKRGKKKRDRQDELRLVDVPGYSVVDAILADQAYLAGRQPDAVLHFEPVLVLPEHDLIMPHRVVSVRDNPGGIEGCPPGCPRRLAAERRCSSCRTELAGKPGPGCQYTGAHKVEARLAELADVLAPRALDDVADMVDDLTPEEYAHIRYGRPLDAGELTAAEAEELATAGLGASPFPPDASELHPAGEETPRQRAIRLDRERDDAGRAYRAATQAADSAWREIGGRP